MCFYLFGLPAVFLDFGGHTILSMLSAIACEHGISSSWNLLQLHVLSSNDLAARIAEFIDSAMFEVIIVYLLVGQWLLVQTSCPIFSRWKMHAPWKWFG
ncbi:uncharacterized protein LOC133029083 isoform X2 [Cannabis sativa]|uniref:uncharacterized protein LOC133029083 isoform X2 n=1 Tax=Cannabis sativa TaxID=3483 RepID=UPI0029C9C84C|nr:uncharacterized protein LOC133029083 isoform X2 [Cannabis sativa]XP_060967661.1 uncharacterized protein LOC133029083 isoform X2 [Cannabis sativa]